MYKGIKNSRPRIDESSRIAEAAPITESIAPKARWSALWTVAVLMLAYILAFIDRQVLNLVAEPIKRDLHLSDVQLSLLQGLSFALFIAISGLPIGRLIDTRSRTATLACGVAVWSIATAACGLASGFGALLCFRILVGIGEATITPASYSIIGDRFSARRQGIVMTTYGLGVYVGSGLALLLGASVVRALPPVAVVPVLGSLRSWQILFVVLLIPGLVIAMLVACLKEPNRRRGVAAPTMRQAVQWLRANFTLLAPLFLTQALEALALYALLAWAPALFHRRFGLAAGDIGHALGLIIMIAGSCGSLTAGLAGDWAAARRAHGRLLVLVAGLVPAIPLIVFSMLAKTANICLTLLAAALFFLTLALSSAPTILQQVTPARLRGLLHSIALLTINLIGLGFGPTAVALVTDKILHDESRLGLALAIVVPTAMVLAMACALVAMPIYRRIVTEGRHIAQPDRPD